jgi:hypothetical protein
MGNIFTAWEKLTDRQKVALGALGGWLGAWAVSKAMDFVSAKVPGTELLTMTAQFIESWLMNRLVIGLLMGALIVTFGPSVWAWVKRVGLGNVISASFGLMFLGVVGLGVWSIATSVYSYFIDSPALYVPPANALKNMDGSKRVFTHYSPRDFKRAIDSNTNLMAHKLLQAEFGKWMAVTGGLRDVSMDSYDKTISGSVGASNGAWGGYLVFDHKWSGQLASLRRGSRIYAVCKIQDVDSLSLKLTNCELSRP